MSNETITLYSAINLSHTIAILKTNKEEYLNCKFWKETKEEAFLFSDLYRGGAQYETHRTIAILSNDVLAVQNLSRLYLATVWLITLSVKIPSSALALLVLNLLKLMYWFDELSDFISRDKSYPETLLIDDVLIWAENNNLISAERLRAIRKKITKVRGAVFSSKNVVEEFRINIIQLFINDAYGSIFYEDAKELLLLEESKLPKLTAAINSGEIIAHFSKNEHIFYLDMKSLLKWLMRQGYFPETWIEHFRNIKIESLNDTANPTPHTFTLEQLRQFLRKYYPYNEDIYYHVSQGIYHAYINMKDGATCFYIENNQPIQIENNLYKTRYVGLERLLSPSTDPYQITKKLLDETTIKASKCASFICLDSTKEEVSFGLQRIFSLRKEDEFQVCHELTCKDLRFVADEVCDGLKKHLISDKKRQKIAAQNGRISGEARREDKDHHWLAIKERALDVAKEFSGESLNKIATIINRRGISTKSPRSICRYIENEPSFKPYFKKK